MTPPRKQHRKTRTGCTTCKRRRVKCDEGRPSCRNCWRGRRQCSYTHAESSIRSPPATTAATTTDEDGENTPDRSQGQLQLPPEEPSEPGTSPRPLSGVSRSQELYLMHHYATVTWTTIANQDSPAEVNLWKVQVPREAMKHEFLLDALLALSSLHLAHLEPEMHQSYFAIGVEYQSRGLHGFKVALDQIKGENINALFAFSVLLTILTLAISSINPDGPCSTPPQSLQSIFELLRGVGVITRTAEDTIRTGMFQILLAPDGGPRPNRHFPGKEEVERAMAKLMERAGHVAKYVGPAQHQVYVSCIESLHSSFEHTSKYQTISRAIAWPVMINDRLMTLLQQRDPMAQLIWVHYGVLLLNINDRWWGKGFAVRLIDSLADSIHSVDDEWAAFTQWPRHRAQIVEQQVES